MVYLIIYRVSTIQGGAGFLPSAVWAMSQGEPTLSSSFLPLSARPPASWSIAGAEILKQMGLAQISPKRATYRSAHYTLMASPLGRAIGKHIPIITINIYIYKCIGRWYKLTIRSPFCGLWHCVTQFIYSKGSPLAEVTQNSRSRARCEQVQLDQ